MLVVVGQPFCLWVKKLSVVGVIIKDINMDYSCI